MFVILSYCPTLPVTRPTCLHLRDLHCPLFVVLMSTFRNFLVYFVQKIDIKTFDQVSEVTKTEVEDALPTSVLLRRIKVAPSPNSIVDSADSAEAGEGRGRGRGGRLVRRRRRRKKNIVSQDQDSASVSVYFAPL